MTDAARPAPKPVVCRIARRDHADDAPRTDVFEVAIGHESTIHELLTAIAEDPTRKAGVRTTPPAWDAHCLEGSCGGCTVRANGRAVLACTTRIEDVVDRRGRLTLGPLEVFPVVRDLVVDRSARDRDLDAIAREARTAQSEAGLLAIDAPAAAAHRAGLHACIDCGACLDACPEASLAGGFVGAEAIVRNRRLHVVPSATPADRDALDRAVMRPGGIADCGHAQNCVLVCPTGVPLAEALADAARAATSRFFRGWRGR